MQIRFAGARSQRAFLSFCLLAATALPGCGGGGGAPVDVGDSPPAQELPDAARTAAPDSVTLSWQPPTENTDGSALTDLAAYRIYSGTHRDELEVRVTIDNPGLSSYVVSPLAPDERYFAISSINSDGIESARSEAVRVAPG